MITSNGKKAAYGSKWQLGLTKREYFAALALQGFASKRDHTIDDDYIRTARASIKLADALLAQLDKQQEK